MTIVVDIGWFPVGIAAALTFLNFKFMRYNLRSEQNMVNLCNNILATLKMMEEKVDGINQPTTNS